MEDLREKLNDLAARAFRTGRPCASEFVSVERAEEARIRLPYVLLGGVSAPERALFVALPDADFPLRTEDFLGALRIVVNDGADYSHRDYLGSILSLGIKREGVGDIVLGAGCAYVITTPPLAKFIRENLAAVSRTGCKCLSVAPDTVPEPERRPEQVTVSVSSERLDCLLSAVFGLSRGDAKALVERGLCTVNRLTVQKSEKLLEAGDAVTLRGYGRFVLEARIGQSKKGKARYTGAREGRTC